MFKKIILAALVVTSAVFAQNVKVGAHAAGSIGTAWGDNTDFLEIGWGAGFNVGAEAKVAINPMLSVVGGIGVDYRRVFWDVGGMMKTQMTKMLDLAGYSYDAYYKSMSSSEKMVMETVLGMESTISLLYIDIPVVARITPIPNLFIDAGIDLGINVSASATTEIMGIEKTEDIDDNMKSTIDFGLVAGLGYSITDKIDIYFRTVIGLTDMVDMTKVVDKLLSGDDDDDDEYGYSFSAAEKYDSSMNFACKNLRFHLGMTFWFM